ncbi:hypothetical protein RhiJN_00847 [Ceratobasidium sp. AG-Ba]|nr:hypothetical protein RhiJN_00847 [Ceratobasidium sp. AG-Ba]
MPVVITCKNSHMTSESIVNSPIAESQPAIPRSHMIVSRDVINGCASLNSSFLGLRIHHALAVVPAEATQ